MRTRQFGDSGLKTSAIGFGGWPMGRGQYGDLDDNEAIAAVHAAFDGGITLYDTLMGKAIKDLKREDIVLVTKGAREWKTDNSDNRTATVADSDPDLLRASIDASLKRLQTDYIDLFLIHWPDKTRPFSDPMEVLEEAKKAGKIRHSGVSNFSVPMMEESLQASPIITDQIGYHMFDRRPEADVLPFVASHGMGVMAYGSMAHGLLTGAWTATQSFGDDDWRKGGANFGIQNWGPEHLAQNIATVEKLKRVAADHGKTIAQLAIAWVLDNPDVSVALAGAKKPAEIIEDLGGDWDLPAGLKRTIDDLVLCEGSGVGTPGMEIAT